VTVAVKCDRHGRVAHVRRECVCVHAGGDHEAWEQFQENLASTTHARRVMTLEEMANMAVFTASDKARVMTGTTVNLTLGSLDD
jgi:enoyl-[acyl-carrier-protein] reductase (NADH)